MLPFIWLVLYGGAIASIFFLAGYGEERFLPIEGGSLRLILGTCHTWRQIVRRICILVFILVAMLCAMLLLLRAGLSLRVYVICATYFVLFHTSKASIFRALAYSRAWAFVFAGLISCVWFFYPHWITTNATSFLLAFFVLIFLRETPVKEAVVLMCAVVIYDTSMVFLSEFMQEVAENANTTPIGVSLPPAIQFIGVNMIGLGDIILPGILIMAVFREAKIRSLPSLPIGAIIGYFYGMIITVIIHNTFHSPQPATLYLIPGVLLGFWAALAMNRVPFLSVIRGTEK